MIPGLGVRVIRLQEICSGAETLFSGMLRRPLVRALVCWTRGRATLSFAVLKQLVLIHLYGVVSVWLNLPAAYCLPVMS